MYYVSTTGNDSNPGTQAAPWKTIQKAANTMVAGQTTIVLAGDYSGQRVQVTKPGAPGAVITYKAQGTVTMKGFTVKANYIAVLGFDISNTDDNWQEGWGIFVQSSYCDIEGNYVHFATTGGIRLWAAAGNWTETSNCVVRNNRLYRNGNAGIDVNGRNHLVEGNEIWGTIQYHPKHPGPQDANGINFSGMGHIIRKNYIHDISYGIPENINPHIDAFQTWADQWHEGAHNVVIEQNLVRNMTVQSTAEVGQGFMLEKASNLIIRNNIIQSYVTVYASNNNQSLTITNNTFVSTLAIPPAGSFSGVYLTATTDAQIKNNIFYDFPDSPVYIFDSLSQQGLDVGYNLVYRSDGKVPKGSPYPHDLWGVNPMFASPATNDYHLEAGSRAIDAADALPSVTNDIDGTLRPQGAGYDIGAYEYRP